MSQRDEGFAGLPFHHQSRSGPSEHEEARRPALYPYSTHRDHVPYALVEALLAKAEQTATQLEAERDTALENVRVREESQIPMIPRGAQEKMERLEVDLQAAERELERLREALVDAETALVQARNGLDLGLGCARDVEGCEVAIPGQNWPRSSRAWQDLEDARRASRRVSAALSADTQR